MAKLTMMAPIVYIYIYIYIHILATKKLGTGRGCMLNLYARQHSIICIGNWNIPFSQLCFPLSVSRWTAQVRTTNRRLYRNILQIWPLYTTWGCYNKFESMKSLGVCYWLSKYHGAGVWSMDYTILGFMLKIYGTFGGLVLVPRWFPMDR